MHSLGTGNPVLHAELTVKEWSLRHAFRAHVLTLSTFTDAIHEDSGRPVHWPVAYLRASNPSPSTLVHVQQAWHLGWFAFIRLLMPTSSAARGGIRRQCSLTVLLLGKPADMASCKRWLRFLQSNSARLYQQRPRHVH